MIKTDLRHILRRFSKIVKKFGPLIPKIDCTENDNIIMSQVALCSNSPAATSLCMDIQVFWSPLFSTA